MRAMGRRMDKLDNIERDVVTLKTQMNEVVTRTRDLEGVVKDHSGDINAMKSTLSNVQASSAKHDKSIEDLWTFSNEAASKADQRVRELKQAIQGNIDKLNQIGDVKEEIKRQVKTNIKEAAQTIKDEITKEIRKEFIDQIKRNQQAAKKELQDMINTNAH